MGDMAAIIFFVMVLIACAGFALLYVCGWVFARLTKASPGRRRLIYLVSGMLGVLGGGIAVTAVFFENVLHPPPTLHFVLEEQTDPAWVILLQDRRSGTSLDWRGVRIPFFGLSTTVRVPANGIVRVTSLTEIDRNGDVQAIWPDGSTAVGHARGPAPIDSGADHYAAWTRGDGTDAKIGPLNVSAGFK